MLLKFHFRNIPIHEAAQTGIVLNDPQDRFRAYPLVRITDIVQHLFELWVVGHRKTISD